MTQFCNSQLINADSSLFEADTATLKTAGNCHLPGTLVCQYDGCFGKFGQQLLNKLCITVTIKQCQIFFCRNNCNSVVTKVAGCKHSSLGQTLGNTGACPNSISTIFHPTAL